MLEWVEMGRGGEEYEEKMHEEGFHRIEKYLDLDTAFYFWPVDLLLRLPFCNIAIVNITPPLLHMYIAQQQVKVYS